MTDFVTNFFTYFTVEFKNEEAELKLFEHFKDVQNYASHQMNDESFASGLGLIIKHYKPRVDYDEDARYFLAATIRHLIKTVRKYHLDKTLTAEDEDVLDIINKLKKFVVEKEY
ncbi:hypothetical protein [Priestia megaterium]|uniref:Uncharacterized protein n=1 Tax=Priestia megaterium TaxID=1404 RepID=A0A6M6E5A5_PRIMG|nr:hypothetical protein [Priestia megaterium]QJX80319.1 hypothetical protein FDZ14_29960 [Priestia megaterium]